MCYYYLADSIRQCSLQSLVLFITNTHSAKTLKKNFGNKLSLEIAYHLNVDRLDEFGYCFVTSSYLKITLI
jgi:hypothetical protein